MKFGLPLMEFLLASEGALGSLGSDWSLSLALASFCLSIFSLIERPGALDSRFLRRILSSSDSSFGGGGRSSRIVEPSPIYKIMLLFIQRYLYSQITTF